MVNENRRERIGDRVTIIPRGMKKFWTAEFHHQGRHCRRSLKTANVKVARQRAGDLDKALRDGDFELKAIVKPTDNAQSITILLAADEYIAFKTTQGCRPKTITKIRSTLRIFREFCDEASIAKVCDVTLRLFDRYRAKRTAERSKKSVHNESVILKSFLGWCAQREMLSKNPLAEQLFERPRCEPRGGPTLEQVNAALVHFRGQRRLALEILAFTGMRAGECERLRADLTDVDLVNNWIHIVNRQGAETKTGDSWKVPIHPRLKASLAAHRPGKRTWFLTENASQKYPEGDHHLNMKRLNEDFQKALKKNGVSVGKKNGGFTLHSLRSFFKTFCVNNNIPREIVDTWQNHRGERRPMASDQYYRLTDDVSQEKIKLVPFGKG